MSKRVRKPEPTANRAKSSSHESRRTFSKGRSRSGSHRRSRSIVVSETTSSSHSSRCASRSYRGFVYGATQLTISAMRMGFGAASSRPPDPARVTLGCFIRATDPLLPPSQSGSALRSLATQRDGGGTTDRDPPCSSAERCRISRLVAREKPPRIPSRESGPLGPPWPHRSQRRRPGADRCSR